MDLIKGDDALLPISWTTPPVLAYPTVAMQEVIDIFLIKRHPRWLTPFLSINPHWGEGVIREITY